ncbi:MAG: CFI-box-CTERM domain-containing protein [Nitrosopumilaceae archaeon]
MRKLLSFVIISLLLILPISNQAWAKYDASHLREPEITVTPTSGPPGTEITITVSNFPDVSDEPYPYPDFYVYLPFAAAIGSNIPGPCGKEMCFPIYTYEDAQRGNFADKTVTFTLFSLSNPKPVYEAGLLHSVCDVVVNGKIQQSFPDTCFKKNQPAGDYEIKFAWATKTHPDEPYFLKTVTFTVTEGGEAPEATSENPADVIIKQYDLGLISEAEFEEKLRDIGYNSEEIRQAKALIGKLPHQIAGQAEEQQQAIEEGMKKAKETIEPAQSSTPKSGCLIATAAFGSELAPQVQFLREFRDDTILTTTAGASFMSVFDAIYYSFSPTVADWERQNPFLQETIKTALYPLLGILQLSIISHTGEPSEFSVLSSGFIAASLIGATYVWPAGFALRGVRNGSRPDAKLALGIILVLTTSVVGALTFSNIAVLIVTTSVLVLSLMGVSAIFTAWAIVRLAQKVRN